MWMYFYKSDRIRDFALSIDPKLEDEIVNFIENINELNAEAEAGISGALSALLSIKAKGKIGNMYKNSQHVKKSITENIITRTIENFLTVDKYTHIDNKFINDEKSDFKNIIRVEGRFKLKVKGKNPTEKIESFDKSLFQEWEGKLKNLTIRFVTNKESFTTENKRPTPILQCLASRTSSLKIDGFVKFDDYENNILTVSPILLGNFIEL